MYKIEKNILPIIISAEMKREAGSELKSNLVVKIKLTPAKIVLIGGGSASGKTTIARNACKLLIARGVSAKCISMDNFYRSLRDDECGETYDWDDIGAFNVIKLIDCIQSWRRGFACWIPQHNFSEYRSIDRAEFIVPTQVIIIEGIHALSIVELLPLAELRLFITCDADEALARRLIRDINERGYDINTILLRYFTFVKPALRDVITPSQRAADYIISNPNNGEVARDNTLELIVGEMVAKMKKNIQCD
jgi:uridine kinase